MCKYYTNNEDKDNQYDEITAEEFNNIYKDFEEACSYDWYNRDFTTTVLNINNINLTIIFNRHRKIIIKAEGGINNV